MGGSVCSPLCSPQLSPDQSDSFRWEYGQDDTPFDQDSGKNLNARVDGIKAQTLKKWQDDLKASKRQYRDPLARSQPVILKAVKQNEQIKCTYERPDVFVIHEEARTRRVFEVFQVQPLGSSGILVEDPALQYVGAFLCFLSDNSQLLSKIIRSEPNSYGMHVIAMHPGDAQQYMLIDDYALCHQKRPLFCRPILDCYIWPCLIERAWLKFIQPSHFIEKKTPTDIFAAFLSHPTASYHLTNTNKPTLVSLLRNSVHSQSDYRCICTSMVTPSHKIGISGRQYFYLINLVATQDNTYYYLRNPCGGFEFRGAVHSPSKELIEAVGQFIQLPAGNFILEEDQFFQQIESVTTMHYNERSSVISKIEMEFPVGEDCYIQLNIPQQTFISLRLTQTDPLPLTYHFVDMKDDSLLAGQDNQHACFGYPHSNLLPSTYMPLPKGRYLLRLKKKQAEGRKKAVSNSEGSMDILTVTANCQISFDYLRVQYLKERFQEFLLKVSRQRFEQMKQSRMKAQGSQGSVAFWLGDLALVYIRNLQERKQKMQVQFANRVNLECLSHQIEKDFYLMPQLQQECLIVFEKVSLTGETELGKYLIDYF